MSDIMERLRGLADLFEAGDAPRHVVLHMRAGADEIERLRAGGCARDQGTTQFCAEAAKKDAEISSLLNLLADARTESMRLRADLRLAVMSDSEECKVLSQEVERLVKSRNRWGQKYNALLEKHKRLRAALSDPTVVHANMLAGVIAKPSLAQIIHIYGEDALRAALEEGRT